jgi:hypothetical protein
MTSNKNNEKTVKIKFDGQLHQVDAGTFIGTLVSFSDIVKEVNKELGSGTNIEIKINATEKGSFDTHLLLVAVEHAQQLLTNDNVQLLGGIVTITGGLYKFKQWLGGRTIAKTSTEGDKTTIEDTNGDVIVINGNVYNLYANNQTVNDAISSGFSNLANDPSVEAIEISDDKDVLFRAEQSEFSTIATKVVIENENTRTSTINVNLVINKMIFEDKNRKWEFIYSGNKISAPISDDSFFESIDNGEKFAKGDQLIVELEITQEYDDALDTYLNKSYKVLRVIEHIGRSSPKQLDILNDINPDK